MRVLGDADLPPAESEIMLDALEQWKWRVEMSAARGAVLVSFSMCPHGLGHLPSALGWQGGGQWRSWPGTFEYTKGSLLQASASESFSAISETAACEGSSDIRRLGTPKVKNLEGCQQQCRRTDGCMAVDFYSKTSWCNLYDRACSKPSRAHDGASSYKRLITSKVVNGIKSQELTFYDAKKWCQQSSECAGFSYSGTWSDRDREGGIPRMVHFSENTQLRTPDGELKWFSYLLRDNPRAQCNPEGQQFDCPANPYACLGLSMDADDSAIKQAYRSLSKKMHPDKVRDRSKDAIKEAEAKFREISESHEILSDVRERHRANNKLHKQRKKWEQERAAIKDIYISDPIISSLEPESYPILIPHGQEWLVHYFLPENDGCKQMKIALALTANELGIGEDERQLLEQSGLEPLPHLGVGEVFRGHLRENTDSLKSERAAPREGDTHIALAVTSAKAGVLYVGSDKSDVSITKLASGKYELGGSTHLLTGSFDKDRQVFRGIVAELTNREKGIASFALRREEPLQLNVTVPPGGRVRPRLFGAVNCGRFPDFCKRKGADPKVQKLFPQVRILFPEEVRYEIYKGRPVGRDLMAYTREATRPQGEVPKLNASQLLGVQAAAQKSLWVILFHWDLSAKTAQDCELCRTARPMLRRTARRLSGAGLELGWMNCTDEGPVCEALGATEQKADWGSLRLVELGGWANAASEELQATRSLPLWDADLLAGKMGQQDLLMAFESAARMAEFLQPPRVDAPSSTSGGARSEL